MVNGATSFNFKLAALMSPAGRLAPFLPLYPRSVVGQDNPYPDAWSLPALPLPLLMRVARFNRSMAFPRMMPIPPIRHTLTGTTKDSSGAALGGCRVDLFDTAAEAFLGTATSDASGNYNVGPASPEKPQFCRAYLAGSPDVAGTTRNDLKGQ